ncbi:unnamed protein product [Acanthoscelides obtectus]|uniref:Uncharacterized protein n=1 Tax=Acanthoscelides obtectus TaxID=200917 RepID=A0A9P0MGA1_ACAOB|nr:unnamed protein product [Acanthoscelides obtectus]CAK1630737.1 hypothetical protein AOBTE_LOCUS6522 [Acanthoscelides obtectus]
MTGQESINTEDYLTIATYLTEIYDTFRGEIPHVKHPKLPLKSRIPKLLPASSKLKHCHTKTSHVCNKCSQKNPVLSQCSKDVLSNSKIIVKKHSCINKRTDSDIPLKTKKIISSVTKDAKGSKSIVGTGHCKPVSSRSSQSSGRKTKCVKVVYRNTSPRKKLLKRESETKSLKVQKIKAEKSRDGCSDISVKKKRKHSNNDIPAKTKASVKQHQSNSKTTSKSQEELVTKRSQTEERDSLYRDPRKETVKQFMARIMLKRKNSILRKICNLSVIQEKQSEPEKPQKNDDAVTEKAEEVEVTVEDPVIMVTQVLEDSLFTIRFSNFSILYFSLLLKAIVLTNASIIHTKIRQNYQKYRIA